jgi:protein gp37
MAKLTPIEWADHIQNPWEGCAQVSPECDHCLGGEPGPGARPMEPAMGHHAFGGSGEIMTKEIS